MADALAHIRAPEGADAALARENAAPARRTHQGALVVTLRREAGLLRVAVSAPPAPPLGRIARGKTPEEVARLAGLLFNVCAAAQEGAARAAFGLPQRPGAARRIAEERLRDHALKLGTVWPQALGMAADRAALAAVSRIAHDDGAALAAALFGRNGPPRRLSELEVWMATGEAPAARVFDHVWRRWDSRWGRAAPTLWRPGLPVCEFDWDAAELDGHPVETSVAARVAETDLMREIEARRGRGLFWRLAARVADATLVLDDLPLGAPGSAPVSPRPGVGVAPAARGSMIARGSVSCGVVTGFDRLSPTDCALHPHGLLHTVMEELPRGSAAPIREVAALALESVDPCLPYRLRFEDPAHA